MMKGGLGNLMRQAQQMQETMQKAQAELADLEVTGESGAGMVKVVLNGHHEAKKVTIEPKLLGEDWTCSRICWSRPSTMRYGKLRRAARKNMRDSCPE